MNDLIIHDVGEPAPNQARPFVCDGTWSLYELIGFLLNYSGRANVFLTSFSISEASIRYIIHQMELGMIKQITAVFDPSLRKTKTALLFFAAGVFSGLKLTPNHSKIVLLQGENMNISLLASANLGRNRRIEAGMIDTRPETFSYFYGKFANIYVNAIDL
jgi:hypothetical protein